MPDSMAAKALAFCRELRTVDPYSANLLRLCMTKGNMSIKRVSKAAAAVEAPMLKTGLLEHVMTLFQNEGQSTHMRTGLHAWAIKNRADFRDTAHIVDAKDSWMVLMVLNTLLKSDADVHALVTWVDEKKTIFTVKKKE